MKDEKDPNYRYGQWNPKGHAQNPNWCVKEVSTGSSIAHARVVLLATCGEG